MTTSRKTTQPFPLLCHHHLLELFGSSDDTLHAMPVRKVHHRALGPGHRKKVAHMELDDERDVLDWLRLHGLQLFIPSAEAALRSVIEAGALGRPSRRGKRNSVYAMLRPEQVVALVRRDLPLGQQIIDGQIELPYNAEIAGEIERVVDPMARVQAAAQLDADAIGKLYVDRLPTARLGKVTP